MDSRNPQTSGFLVMAEVKLQAGRPEEALEAVGKAEGYARGLRIATVYNLEFLRGDALARMNRPDEAEAAFRREIAAFPAHAQGYANLAVIRFIRGDRTATETLLADMVRANPSSRTCLLAASTCDSLGEKEKAAAWRRQAERSAKGGTK